MSFEMIFRAASMPHGKPDAAAQDLAVLACTILAGAMARAPDQGRDLPLGRGRRQCGVGLVEEDRETRAEPE
jgi:hypothetical protein